MASPNNNLSNPSVEAITLYFSQPDLLRDLLSQILKDFKTAQIDLVLEIEEPYSFEALRDLLQITLEIHLQKGGSLKYLLNRVDLTERQIKREIPQKIGHHLRLFSELIIKRELQKVVIRHWYRQQEQK